MKVKLVALVAAGAVSLGTASAVSVTLTGIANTTVGLVTDGASSTTLSGSAFFYSSSINLAPADLTGLATAPDPRAFFEGLLTSDPGLVRGPVSFTNGAFTSSGPQEMGAIGNFTYLYLANTGSSLVGVYQGQNVPGVGAVTINPSTATEDLFGTSVLQNISGTNSGFQLMPVVPEPSIVLLGSLGFLGLLRRRR